MAWEHDLADEFKKRNNKAPMGPIVGIVVSEPPELKILISDGQIKLENEHLYMCQHAMKDYEREFEIENTTDVTSNTNGVNVGDHGSHSHVLTNIALKSTIKWTDTLKVGDEVLLIPSTSEQMYFIIDKVVKL